MQNATGNVWLFVGLYIKVYLAALHVEPWGYLHERLPIHGDLGLALLEHCAVGSFLNLPNLSIDRDMLAVP